MVLASSPRPIYAGNAIATVRATMPGVHMLTVRTTAFPPAVAHPEGVVTGASIEAVSESELSAARGCDGGAEWVGEDVAVGERPELTSAKVVVSGRTFILASPSSGSKDIGQAHGNNTNYALILSKCRIPITAM